MTDFDSIKPGLEAERTITIEEKHTVSHTGVPVLGTPMMVGLIEMGLRCVGSTMPTDIDCAAAPCIRPPGARNAAICTFTTDC